MKQGIIICVNNEFCVFVVPVIYIYVLLGVGIFIIAFIPWCCYYFCIKKTDVGDFYPGMVSMQEQDQEQDQDQDKLITLNDDQGQIECYIILCF